MASSSIEIDSDVLKSIQVTPNLNFTLQDILAKYGTPAGLSIGYELDPHNLDTTTIKLTLYYPTLGLAVRFSFQASSTALQKLDLVPGMPGLDFSVHKPTPNLDDFVSEVYDYQGQRLKGFMGRVIQGWPGFNTVFTLGNEVTDPQIFTVTPNLSPQTTTP